MADFYGEMKAVAASMLAPTSAGGLGQGVIKLTRVVPATPNPSSPWTPVAPVRTTETINGAVRGVDAELVGVEAGGTVILASDLIAVCTPPKITFSAGDTLEIDSKAYNIISVQNVPAAGIAVVTKFVVRG